ncbi:hypothetical protein DTL42_23155 [Bremerella cremea]|uniref:Prenyltransferase n=1 Tax=Bremerella cremea TaxID=1031537 RepID=A0A368KN97_9BACT|nr:UbiA family prenyltransferase [Bremerella cremea]RCS41455.1 hypothetical protein DTL42_23155 [Bremerella cremea]
MEENSQTETALDPPWLAFCKLCRLPNLFTAWADILAGFFVVSFYSSERLTGLDFPLELMCLLLASSLIYSAGMVLNDYYDREIDAEQRPDRPIPSGAISAGAAMAIGYGMLAAGCLFALLGGFVYVDSAAIAWRGGVVAVVLSASVVAYDAVLKRTALAPWIMGACRFFNILLGMSLAQALPQEGHWQVFGYDAGQLLFAGGIGLYIVGVTWFARTEAVASDQRMLIAGAILMAGGIGMLAALPVAQPSVVALAQLTPSGLWGILVLLSLVLARRAVIAIARPDPRNVQLTVKQAILSLIFYDAAITLAVCGTGWSVAIVALLLPMLGLRRWMYST